MNLNKFNNQILSTDFLLGTGINMMYKKENFTVDNNIIALLDISSKQRIITGNSIVIHNEFGVFFVDKTTKQLMNEFHKYNYAGFMLTKFMAEAYHMKRNIPMVFGSVSYMPMSGGSRNCTDWIGIHRILDCQQVGVRARFKLEYDSIIEMDFPRGNLNDRVHDVCVISEAQVKAIRVWMLRANLEVRVCSNVTQFLNDRKVCGCMFHDAPPKEWNEIHIRLDQLRDFLLEVMTRNEIENKQTRIVYVQKTMRLKLLC